MPDRTKRITRAAHTLPIAFLNLFANGFVGLLEIEIVYSLQKDMELWVYHPTISKSEGYSVQVVNMGPYHLQMDFMGPLEMAENKWVTKLVSPQSVYFTTGFWDHLV